MVHDPGTREYQVDETTGQTPRRLVPPDNDRPVWQRGWFVALSLLVLAALGIWVGTLLGGDAADVPVVAETPARDEPDAQEEEPADPEEPGEVTEPSDTDPAELYPVFEPVAEFGTGDAVIDLPANATSAIVTATHSGEGEFTITVVDPDDPAGQDAPVSVFGPYAGVTAYGLSPDLRHIEDLEPTRLEITTDGSWQIEIAPVISAPPLDLPASGTGDAVFLYDGDATEWTVTHRGPSDFVVAQYRGVTPSVLVRETGDVERTVVVEAIPSPIVIMADGEWTIAGG